MIFNKDELQYIQNAMETYKNSKEQEMTVEECSAHEYLKNKIDTSIQSWETLSPLEKEIDDKFFKFMNMANYYKTKNYQFMMDCENVIEVTGDILESGGFMRTMDSNTLSEYIDEEVKEWLDCNYNIQNDLRFCSICGAPMQEGFMSEKEDMYIESEIEFVNHMNTIHGSGNWRCATPEEEAKFDAVYVYRDNDQSNEWKPMDWGYTEWYNEYPY